MAAPVRTARGAKSAGLAAILAAALGGACGDDTSASSTSGGAGAAGTTTGASTSTTATGLGGAGGAGPGGVGGLGGAGVGGDAFPESFDVEGVVTDGTSPVAGASVLQGGGDVQVVTGDDGAFRVRLGRDLPGLPTLVAGKLGYRAAGLELNRPPDGPVELVLHAIEPPDNAGYPFGEPGTGDPAHDVSTDYCGHCHTTFVATFQGSAHQRATRDPWVQDLYAGVATARSSGPACDEAGGELRAGVVPGSPGETAPRCYVGDGVLPDLNACGAPGDLACDDPARASRPTSFGACADCHGAGMDGPAGGRDLLEASGIGFENGNHCDACHKVSAIDLEAAPGTAGRLVLQRPNERLDDGPPVKRRQVMYGPFLDVPNPFMGGSVQPAFTEAVFCAGCHEQRQAALVPGDTLDEGRWPDGLPIHSTFAEWSASDYAASGVPCQSCHMPTLPGMFNSVDVVLPSDASLAGGFGRPEARNRSHAFVGALEGTPRMIERALAMTLSSRRVGDVLSLDAVLGNFGAGHAVPTGEPMRSMVLALEVDACGVRADAVDGGSVGDVGGAIATTEVGDGEIPAGVTSTPTWPRGAALATAGSRLRVVRPTGTFLDYPGVGAFADPALTPEEKGVAVRTPIHDVEVVAVDGDTLTLAAPIGLAPGDVVVLGESPGAEGDEVRALAGMPGRDFARVLRDASGRLGVPHHRAVDVVSDDRIPPSGEVVSSHAFAVPAACPEAVVRATLFYRRAPRALARERGWATSEHVVTTQTIVVPAPL